jgi:hypothetical protein
MENGLGNQMDQKGIHSSGPHPYLVDRDLSEWLPLGTQRHPKPLDHHLLGNLHPEEFARRCCGA